MFKSLRSVDTKTLNHSGRSHVGETMQLEGDLRTSGAIDVAGLVKGPVISKEIVVRETGSITGSIEGDRIEIHGHMDGKISGEDVIIGSTGTVKGDVEFGNNLRTENGADIDGYIKKTHGSKSKLAPDFLFSKTKEEKKPKENGGSETVLNKDTEFLA